jgi:GNAT superfamily N-acetyltransferase/predicted nucleic acid-binding protein
VTRRPLNSDCNYDIFFTFCVEAAKMAKIHEAAMSVTIKVSPEDVTPHLPDVKAGADTAKEELGFLPHRVYDEFAVAGKLLVATMIISGIETYAGHMMFGGIYPHAKVFQLFIAPAFRGNGIARQLVMVLKERLCSNQWLSIKASVADDLPANAVWARMGFLIVRTKTGGVARKRQINVRVLELDTPSLLGYMGRPAHQDGFRFTERLFHRPIYLIDLNVLFDAVRKRHRSVSAAKVVRAGMSNSIRLMVADEFTQELLRTSSDPNNDPILAFAAQLGSLSRPPEKEVRSLTTKLAPIIFPDRSRQNTMTERDSSDLIHIATAIYHRAAGFITSEKAILRAHSYLNEKWNFDVISVEEFALLVDPGERVPRVSVADVFTETLQVRRDDETDLAHAHTFLEAMHLPPLFVHEALAYQETQVHWLLILGPTAPLGFAKWDVHGGLKRTADVFLCVDEAHRAAETILDHLLDVIPRELSKIGPTLIRLNIPPGHVATRQAALSSGFLPPYGAQPGDPKLQRLAVGRVVSAENWASVRKSLASVASVSLPAQVPTFEAVRERMLVNTAGQDFGMPLADVERFLAPVLFLCPGRAGVIVPIREYFASELIGTGHQISMLAPPEAILRRERVYISAKANVSRMKPGALILFYESLKSKGRGCVVAIARITYSKVVSKADALDTAQRRGVLDRRTLEMRSVYRDVTETSFDNIFILGSPVPLKRLRELGCADGSNLISPRVISFEKLIQIVAEGHIDDWC